MPDDLLRGDNQMEYRLRALFERMDQVFYLIELIRNNAGEVINLCYLGENPVKYGALAENGRVDMNGH